MSNHSRMVWRLALVSLVAPVAAYLVVVAWAWAELPNPVATHWDATGAVDGTMSATTGALVLPVSLLIGVGGLLVVLAAVVPERAPGRRWVLALPAGISWFIGVLLAASLLAQRGVSSADAAQFSQLWILPALGVGALMTWVVARGIPAPPPAAARTAGPPSDAPRLPVGDQTQVWWSGYAAGGTSVRVLAAILVAGAVAAGVAALWVVAAVLVIVAVLTLALTAYRVVIGPQQLVARGVVGWPRLQIPLESVTAAEVSQIDPLRWGGWGLRYRPGAVGLVTRRGPGLTLRLTDDTTLALTVEDAQTAAETVNTLLDRSAI